MIPVKSISQLNNFQKQGESLIPFEQLALDSNISLNHYSLSANDTRYNNLFAGNLKDGELYLEVSYLSSNNTYVPRKFDFGNYLRYIENALSILNNGIMGVYLTKPQADELYVRKIGDTMTGPLTIDMSDTSENQVGAPLVIQDTRSTADSYDYGAIQIKGDPTSQILLYDKDGSIPKVALSVSNNKPEINVNNVLLAFNDKILLQTVLETAFNVTTPHITDQKTGSLTLTKTQVNNELTANNGIKAINGLNVSSGNLTVATGSATIQSGLTSTTGTIKAPTLEATSVLKCGTTFTATSGTSVSISKPLTASDGITTNSLIVSASGNNIFKATSSKIELFKETEMNDKCTVNNSSLYLNNGNVVMTGASPKIYFGTEAASSPNISYDSTVPAFVITSLKVSTKLTVGGSGSGGTAAADVTTSTNASNPTLVVYGDADYKASVFSSEAVKAGKLVTTNFTAKDITATGKFTQENGIAELTAKRACWA